MTTDRRVFVLGVSGATWRIARPMMDAGDLPNLAQLCRSGVSGVLASVKAPGDKHFRPQTAWPSLATGCLPEHHGITRFFHTSQDLVRPTMWRLLSDSGRRVGLFGWPMTWPVRPINGFDVPCHHARDGQAWPPHLEVRQASSSTLRVRSALTGITRLARHGALLPLLPRIASAAGRMASTRDARRRGILLGHLKQEVACELFRTFYRRFQPHASAFVTFLVDWTSHRYWRYHEPSLFPGPDRGPAGFAATSIEDAYRKVDVFLGRIRSTLAEDSIVAVVSEHGMAPETSPAEIGDWRYAIHGANLRKLLGLEEDVDPRPIARWIALRRPAGGSLPADTASRLREVLVAETGHPVFQVHEHRGEVIVKFNLSRAVGPSRSGDLEQLRLRWRDRDLPFLALAVRADRQRSAMHAEEGLLVLSGPGIRRDGAIEGARIIDVAPTLLDAVGFSRRDLAFDGRSLDVFSGARSASPGHR